MRPICLVFPLTILFSTLLLTQSVPGNNPLVSKNAVADLSQPDPAMQGRITENYGKLPLSFEANHGQADGRVKFLSRTGGYTLFLTSDEAVLAMRWKKVKKSSHQGPKAASLADSGGTPKAVPFLKTLHGTSSSPDAVATEDMTTSVLRMKLHNANPAARVTGVEELPGTSNYFIGNDPAKWRSDVPTYAKVKYEGIYSGIDLVYYGNQRQLEYDFIVAPGADPRRVAFDIRGAKRIRQDAHGDLLLKMGEGEIRWHKPVVYQVKEGTRQEIAARYAITALRTASLNGGVAKFTTSTLTSGKHNITATYNGSINFSGSSASLIQTVN